MRTTIRVDDNLLKAARKRASQRGMTLGQLIEDALRQELAGDRRASAPPTVPVFEGGSGVQPGVDATSTRALLELLDEGRPIEQLR